MSSLSRAFQCAVLRRARAALEQGASLQRAVMLGTEVIVSVLREHGMLRDFGSIAPQEAFHVLGLCADEEQRDNLGWAAAIWGVALVKMGDPAHALPWLEISRAALGLRHRQSEDAILWAWSLDALAICYQLAGKNEERVEAKEFATQILASISRDTLYVSSMGALDQAADAFLAGNLVDALAILSKAKASLPSDSFGVVPIIAAMLDARADEFRALRAPFESHSAPQSRDLAEACCAIARTCFALDQMIRLLPENADRFTSGMVGERIRLAAMYLQIGNIEAARCTCAEALARAAEATHPSAYRWLVTSIMIPVAFAATGVGAAPCFFAKLAVEAFQEMRSTLAETNSALGTLATGTPSWMFQNAVLALKVSGRFAEASAMLDLARLAEIDPLGEIKRALPRLAMPSFTPGEAAARQLIQTAWSRPDAHEIEQMLRRIETELTYALDESHAELSALQQRLLDGLRSVLPSQDDGATVVLHLIMEPSGPSWLVQVGNEYKTVYLSVDQQEIYQSAFQFLAACASRHTTPVEYARRIYEQIFAPIEDILREANARTLVYAVIGPLYGLPLGALHDGTGWLVERFDIIRAALPGLDVGSLPILPVTAIGCSASKFVRPGLRALEGAGREVETFQRQAKRFGRAETVKDDRFNQDALLSALKSATVLHLACHCLLDPADAGGGRLVLGDGQEFAFETFLKQDLSSLDLLVLSACDTGVTTSPDDPRGTFTIDRALVAGGARAVLATAWKVADAAQAALMEEFYSHLFSETPLAKHSALARAQRSILQRGRLSKNRSEALWSHPYYWAAPTLCGNWQAFTPHNAGVAQQ